MRVIRVFVSSPGDVEEERRRARLVIERVGNWFHGRAVVKPVLWEDAPLRATASFQDGISEQIGLEEIDVAVFVLWSRIGTPLGGHFKDGDRDRTGTEWEFEQVKALHERTKRPDILVYRRMSEPPRVSVKARSEEVLEALAQSRAVEGFFDRWFREGPSGRFVAASHCYGSPDGFAEIFERHLRGLVAERLALAEGGAPTWSGSPFRGLLAFDVEHAPVFFGRARVTADALRALQAQAARGAAYLLILGSSGSGKSSLARAGVLAQLDAPSVVEPGAAAGFVVRAALRPADGADPFESLLAALDAPGALGPDPCGVSMRADLVRSFRESPAAAVAHVKQRLLAEARRRAEAQNLAEPPTARLALLVDQMEELFSREGASAADRAAFGRVLAALARSGVCWVVATLRSDFYGRLDEVPELAALRGDGAGHLDLGPPSPHEIAEMVRLPAEAAGLRFERDPVTGQGLDDALIDACAGNPGALPLLQFTLETLYERREGATLSWAAYEALRGLAGALAERAEETFRAQPPEVRAALPSVVRSLVDVGEGQDAPATRRRPPLEGLRRDPACASLVTAFLAARLLESDRDTRGRPVVGVAHEHLLTEWPRFAASIAADREMLQVRGRMSRAADHWERAGRDASLLLVEGLPLRDAERLLDAGFLDLDATTKAFVDASVGAAKARAEALVTAARRRRRLRRIAAAVVLLAAVGVYAGLRLARDAAVRGHLAAADAALAAGRTEDASAAVAKALARDPDSADAVRKAAEVDAARAAVEERRREAVAREQAASARAEATEAARLHDVLRARIAAERVDVDRARKTVFGAYESTAARAEFARREKELARMEADAVRLSQDEREALERAARAEAPWGGTSAATKEAFVAHHLGAWRDAVAADDPALARAAREQVVAYGGLSHAAELAGLGALTVDVRPPDATVHLFRYESYETVRTAPAVVPRLVPVPTTGRGRCREDAGCSWSGDPDDPFLPGDPCLVATAVAPGSPAAAAGLGAGDLVLRIDGAPCGDGLFVGEVRDGPARAAGIAPHQRVERLGTEVVEGPYEWAQAQPAVGEGAGGAPPRAAAGPLDLVTVAGGERRTSRARAATSLEEAFGVEVLAPEEVLRRPARAALRLRCLRAGMPVLVEVPAGRASGLEVERTAYPLIPSRENVVEVGTARDVEPGSYLLLVRSPGFEDQRYPVRVDRNEKVPVAVRLLPAGSSPPGFVYVPPSRFVYGGDPRAIQSVDLERDRTSGEGVFVARRTVTHREWFRFVNSPGILERVRASRAGAEAQLLPRDSGTLRGWATEREDGTFAPVPGEDVPVYGVSRWDCREYVAWLNAQADAVAGPWTYDLPTEEEWEHAARGADGRWFPWGDRFDFSLCVCSYRKRTELRDVFDFEPRDESPFGVREMAGSRWQWARDEIPPKSGTTPTGAYPRRGGCFGYWDPTNFRCASRIGFDPRLPSDYGGLRLVARPKRGR